MKDIGCNLEVESWVEVMQLNGKIGSLMGGQGKQTLDGGNTKAYPGM